MSVGLRKIKERSKLVVVLAACGFCSLQLKQINNKFS